jgi:hypothetical protein
MAIEKRKQEIDAVIAFILLKKLLTPINQTDAFKTGVVDAKGVAMSDDKELSVLDKIIFKLKRLMGGKIHALNKFIYVKTLGGDYTRYLIPQAGVGKRAEVKRLMRDIDKLNEKYELDGLDEMFEMIIHEELQKMTDYNGYIKEDYFK